MAFHTRKIKIKALNDSKQITAIIYINSITLIVLAITEFSLQQNVDVYHAVVGLVLIVEATMFTGIVFIPKVSFKILSLGSNDYYYYYYYNDSYVFDWRVLICKIISVIDFYTVTVHKLIILMKDKLLLILL